MRALALVGRKGPEMILPRALSSAVLNELPAHASRPVLPIPATKKVHAFTTQEALERWSEDAAGVRPVNLARDDNVITIFGYIGEDIWSADGGTTAKKVASQLTAIGERPIEVQINSPGGDVFEGIAIYNLLREHKAEITVKIMGMAASAASVIAMAGDRREIGAASFIMIHNTWVMAMGNRHDMRETADFLEPFDAALRGLYAQATGQDEKKIGKWLDDESYFSGAQAIELGFAHALLPSDQVSQGEEAQVSDREINEIRALELSLVKSGLSRGQARAKIKALKGQTTPGAGEPAASTPGAGAELAGPLSGLLATFTGSRK